MVVQGSFRRRVEWVLFLGGVSVACGGKTASSNGGAIPPSGGTAGTASGNPSGGAIGPTGGSANTGGTGSGGLPTGGKATGGDIGWTGGSSSGSTSTGGNASGGGPTGGAASTCYGTVVSTLPTQGACCGQPACASEPGTGTSLCLANGDRCVCQRGVWFCNNPCPDTEPTPNTSCNQGAACNYSNGTVGCACINGLWFCLGSSGCPDSANQPVTGDVCNGLTNVFCDYPDPANPLDPHLACVCNPTGDPSSGSQWTCIQSGRCQTTQPAYGTTCNGTADCTYSTPPYHCVCLQAGTPWVCV